MLTCESCEILIADALLDELSLMQKRQLDQHLGSCGSCQSLFYELRETQGLLNANGLAAGRFENTAELDQLWDRLQPALDQIDGERSPRRSGSGFLPYLAGAGAMAAGLLIVIFVFDLSIQSRQPLVEVADTAVSEPSGNAELMAYLRRVETLLLTVANSESENNAESPLRQGFARSMAREAGYMTTKLDDQFNSGQSRLLRDIESVLLQIANLDAGNMNEGVRLLQRFIEDNSILFRMRLLEMRQPQYTRTL